MPLKIGQISDWVRLQLRADAGHHGQRHRPFSCDEAGVHVSLYVTPINQDPASRSFDQPSAAIRRLPVELIEPLCHLGLARTPGNLMAVPTDGQYLTETT
jgi:hypothetical protein